MFSVRARHTRLTCEKNLSGVRLEREPHGDGQASSEDGLVVVGRSDKDHRHRRGDRVKGPSRAGKTHETG